MMTTRDNIIFFSILSVVILLVTVPFYIEKHVSGGGRDDPLIEHVTPSQDDEMHEEKNSMISNITAIIIALGTAITILYGIPNYREKMRRNRIDKLKDRMLVLFSEGWNHQRIHTPETEKAFFKELGPKFQKKRYKILHQVAYDELGREGRNDAWRHKDLKRQMIERHMVQKAEAAMPGPDGMIYRGGGRIIRESGEDRDEDS